MTPVHTAAAGPVVRNRALSLSIVGDWTEEDISLYLERCQIDTPDRLVRATWKHISDRRKEIGKVVDFGAGDGRFARYGTYREYRGYEIDRARSCEALLPKNAQLVHRCAFSEAVYDADVCIGNPPFVRNQDLPTGWRNEVSEQLSRRSGVTISGLASSCPGIGDFRRASAVMKLMREHIRPISLAAGCRLAGVTRDRKGNGCFRVGEAHSAGRQRSISGQRRPRASAQQMTSKHQQIEADDRAPDIALERRPRFPGAAIQPKYPLQERDVAFNPGTEVA